LKPSIETVLFEHELKRVTSIFVYFLLFVACLGW